MISIDFTERELGILAEFLGSFTGAEDALGSAFDKLSAACDEHGVDKPTLYVTITGGSGDKYDITPTIWVETHVGQALQPSETRRIIWASHTQHNITSPAKDSDEEFDWTR